MHIIMLADIERQGGAAVAATRLAGGLIKAGHHVTRVVYADDGQTHAWRTERIRLPYDGAGNLPGLSAIWPWVSGTYARARLWQLLRRLRPDAINVHNLHSASWSSSFGGLLSMCAAWAPTFWTLHDMWSFTGRCAYSYDCRKFLTGCDAACPTPLEYPSLAPNKIAGAWQRRQRFMSATNLVAISPSRWLAREATAGLWGNRVHVIPNGVPLGVYCPVDRLAARRALGIEPGGRVLMTAAQDFSDRRKGGALLVGALRALNVGAVTVLTMGMGRLEVDAPGVAMHQLGYVEDESTKVLAFNAADAFVHSAPVDNLPNVVLEAIACGTPVVGFAIGGVPEMVRPGRTGWLARSLASGALASAIEQALKDLDDGIDLRASCRDLAVAEYGDNLQAERYAALFCESNMTSRETAPLTSC